MERYADTPRFDKGQPPSGQLRLGFPEPLVSPQRAGRLVVIAVKAAAAAGPQMPVDAAIALALELVNDGPVGNPTAARYSGLWIAFRRYAAVAGAEQVEHLTPQFIAGWLRARTRRGLPPSAATQNLRRTALRHLFSILRSVGVVQGDPTIDLELPHRTGLVVRALTGAEVAALRSASLRTTVDTQQPAILALAEAGAGSAEIPKISSDDLDLPNRVWIPGHTKSDPRWATLSAWGASQLARRLRSGSASPEESITYRGTGPIESAQASTSATLRGVFTRAGITDPSTGLKSLRVTYGLNVLASTGRVEDAARALGMRSLDETCTLLGVRWRSTP